jgi:uncharacterized Zn finger protein
MKAPKSLGQLLTSAAIRELSTPANHRYGTAIFKRKGVQFIEVGRIEAQARVGGLSGSTVEGGGQRRRTRLLVRRGGLGWHCAGNPKDHQIFCKHCVALALAFLDSEAKRKRKRGRASNA